MNRIGKIRELKKIPRIGKIIPLDFLAKRKEEERKKDGGKSQNRCPVCSQPIET